MTEEFEEWLEGLSLDEQESIAVSVRLLQELGPSLSRPHSDTLYGSKFSNMKELRTQHAGKAYRSLYAFDPRRTAILLIGGKKTENKRWYKEYLSRADKLYQDHLDMLQVED